MTHHRRGLRRLLRNDELLRAIETDWRSAGLDPRTEAMLDYAERLTLDPAAVTRDAVQALRNVGFADADILAVAEVTGYYAYANRIADGLGVELESERASEVDGDREADG